MACNVEIINNTNWVNPNSPEFERPYVPVCGGCDACRNNAGEYLDSVLFPPLELSENIIIARLTR